jgi:hypothetical protein
VLVWALACQTILVFHLNNGSHGSCRQVLRPAVANSGASWLPG